MLLLPLARRDHDNDVPRTPLQVGILGPAPDALLAPHTLQRIHPDAAEGGRILCRDEEHAVVHGTVDLTHRRAGAAAAALGDDRQQLGFLGAAPNELAVSALLRGARRISDASAAVFDSRRWLYGAHRYHQSGVLRF